MKIEPTGIQPLAPKPTEKAASVEKREDASESESTTRAGADKIEMSKNARLLAKARAALDSSESANAEKVALLKQQVESGDYTVQVSDIARKLLGRFFPK